jgi:hypothetical protein
MSDAADLPRDRVGTGHATDAQWAAARRWSARYRREHRHEDPWARWDRAETADETERWRNT